MNTIVNMTPHEVRVMDGDKTVGLFQPSGTVARVSQTREQVGTVAGIPVYQSTYGTVTGLPEAEDGTWLIVSSLVRLALPDRGDLLSPGTLVRGADGQPIGCQGLEGNL